MDFTTITNSVNAFLIDQGVPWDFKSCLITLVVLFVLTELIYVILVSLNKKGVKEDYLGMSLLYKIGSIGIALLLMGIVRNPIIFVKILIFIAIVAAGVGYYLLNATLAKKISGAKK